VLNTYPFEKTAKSGASFDDCIENIDIGGVAMLRSAAKNHKYVATLTSPNQYNNFIDEMKKNEGSISLDTRKQLASDAFKLSSDYESSISKWMSAEVKPKPKTMGQQINLDIKQDKDELLAWDKMDNLIPAIV